jgi:hypothetical protein
VSELRKTLHYQAHLICCMYGMVWYGIVRYGMVWHSYITISGARSFIVMGLVSYLGVDHHQQNQRYLSML